MKDKITYEITIDSQPMIVHYEPDSIGNIVGHFEFLSPHNPRKRIPLSETGYRSEFIFMDVLRNIQDMEAYIYDLANHIIKEETNRETIDKENEEQMALF